MDTEKMAKEALQRLHEWINRSAAQHLRQWRAANARR